MFWCLDIALHQKSQSRKQRTRGSHPKSQVWERTQTENAQLPHSNKKLTVFRMEIASVCVLSLVMSAAHNFRAIDPATIGGNPRRFRISRYSRTTRDFQWEKSVPRCRHRNERKDLQNAMLTAQCCL